MEKAADALKEVMRVSPQGVNVVTTKSGSKLYGITVGSFTSVSLAPPLILVSIAKASANHDVFTGAREFAISLLADDQKSVSDRFAGRTQLGYRFGGLGIYSDVTDAPIIAGARAYLECKRWRVQDGGDHSLLLGEVINAKHLNDKPPLVYYTQQYTTIVFPENAPSPPESLW